MIGRRWIYVLEKETCSLGIKLSTIRQDIKIALLVFVIHKIKEMFFNFNLMEGN